MGFLENCVFLKILVSLLFEPRERELLTLRQFLMRSSAASQIFRKITHTVGGGAFQAPPWKNRAAKRIKTRQQNIKRLDIEVIATVDMLYGRKVLQSF